MKSVKISSVKYGAFRPNRCGVICKVNFVSDNGQLSYYMPKLQVRAFKKIRISATLIDVARRARDGRGGGGGSGGSMVLSLWRVDLVLEDSCVVVFASERAR